MFFVCVLLLFWEKNKKQQEQKQKKTTKGKIKGGFSIFFFVSMSKYFQKIQSEQKHKHENKNLAEKIFFSFNTNNNHHAESFQSLWDLRFCVQSFHYRQQQLVVISFLVVVEFVVESEYFGLLLLVLLWRC